MGNSITDGMRMMAGVTRDITDTVTAVVDGNAFLALPPVEGSGPDSIFFDPTGQPLNEQAAHVIWSYGTSCSGGWRLLADGTESALEKAKRLLLS